MSNVTKVFITAQQGQMLIDALDDYIETEKAAGNFDNAREADRFADLLVRRVDALEKSQRASKQRPVAAVVVEGEAEDVPYLSDL